MEGTARGLSYCAREGGGGDVTGTFSQTGAVQEQMRSKGNRDRPWSNSRGL